MIIKRYVLALLVLILILVAHILAMFNGWYYIQYFDVGMHIAGGFGIALLCIAIMGRRTKNMSNKVLFRNIILGTMLFGLLWEIFEIVEDVSGFPLWSNPYMIDTLKDLVNDFIGGTITYFVFLKIKK